MSDDEDKAAAKLKDAQWQYRMAESALARATAVLDEAERECSRLFRKRMTEGHGK